MRAAGLEPHRLMPSYGRNAGLLIRPSRTAGPAMSFNSIDHPLPVRGAIADIADVKALPTASIWPIAAFRREI